jgi:hypothetical protein
MKKQTKTVKRMSDKEFERQYAKAVKRGKESMKKYPCAKRVRYDKRSRSVRVELTNGCTFIFPPDLVQGLADVSDEVLADVELLGLGFAIVFTRLDMEYSIAGLMQGVFGNKAWMTELWSKNSEAERFTSRRNGRKSKQPQKKQAA